MRISTQPNDPGYAINAFMFHVLLDGKRLDHCFTADEETGEAWCFVSDENGRLIANCGEMRIEKKTGKVEIIYGRGEDHEQA